MSMQCVNDNSFNGLEPTEEVLAEIRAKYPEHRIATLPVGSMVTMDYDTSRIRIWLEDGTIGEFSEG